MRHLATLPNSRFANAQELATVLASLDTKLLVMPYGSAFPEAAWPAIYAYLQRGGNLLTLGGRPFAQAAYRECAANNVCVWKLRYPRNAWAKALFINDYTETPGPKGSVGARQRRPARGDSAVDRVEALLESRSCA